MKKKVAEDEEVITRQNQRIYYLVYIIYYIVFLLLEKILIYVAVVNAIFALTLTKQRGCGALII